MHGLNGIVWGMGWWWIIGIIIIVAIVWMVAKTANKIVWRTLPTVCVNFSHFAFPKVNTDNLNPDEKNSLLLI
jgi:hypothetical protein